jgi:hypothetical protein
MDHDPDPLEKMRKLAVAGVKVLGSNETIFADREHHCDRGTWGFIGALGAVAVMMFTNIGPWWTLGIALAVGWAVNAWEHRNIRKRIAEMERRLKSAEEGDVGRF